MSKQPLIKFSNLNQTEKNTLLNQIHTDYRCGHKSLKQLAKDHNVSYRTLIYYKRKDKWAKDLKIDYKSLLETSLFQASDTEESRKALDQAVDETLAVINSHKKTAKAVLTGIQAVQTAINALMARSDVHKMDKETLKALSIAQKQNSHSLVNLITTDRRTYDLESTKDNMPDKLIINFYRDKAPEPIKVGEGRVSHPAPKKNE